MHSLRRVCRAPLGGAGRLFRGRPAQSMSRSTLRLPQPRLLSSSSSLSSRVPVIDIGPFISGDKAGKGKVAAEVGRACEDIGFLVITNHGVNKQVIHGMEEVTRRFFDENVAVKKAVPMTDDYPYGYSGYLEENLQRGLGDKHAKPDLKESFCIGPYNPAAGMPPILWPPSPKELPKVWLDYYKSMEQLAANMLRIFALALELPENFFDDKIDHHRSALRALNYPEQDASLSPPEGQFRAGAHTDYGSLTILLQDDVGGLEAKDRAGVWQSVPYVEDSYVINIGDLMSRWTNDKWVSTLHRVLFSHPRRQSIAFFHNINHDHMVRTIDTCVSDTNPSRYEPILAWDHLLKKHTESTKY